MGCADRRLRGTAATRTPAWVRQQECCHSGLACAVQEPEAASLALFPWTEEHGSHLHLLTVMQKSVPLEKLQRNSSGENAGGRGQRCSPSPPACCKECHHGRPRLLCPALMARSPQTYTVQNQK